MKRRSFLKGTIGAGILLSLGIKPEPPKRVFLSAKDIVGVQPMNKLGGPQLPYDHEAELTRLMAEELSREIDREIIQALRGVS